MSKIAITALAAFALAASPIAPVAPAHAQGGNPLNSIFGCQSGGSQQATGAIVGAILGGALSNTTSSKRTRGRNTVLGAAVGAAAGSYIGCRMQVGDQQRAEAATREALDNGQNASWNNPETGASGRVTMVSSRPYDASFNEPASLSGVRFAQGVEPQGPYTGASGRYRAPNRVNLRGTPSSEGRVVGQLGAGETFEALARVRAYPSDWLLAGRNGVAIGYVSDAVVEPQTRSYSSNGGRGQMCRTFDQSVTTGSGETETNRYTACQTATGEWVVQG
jgi:surface antigen